MERYFEQIRLDYMRLTIDLLQKDIKYVNKQLQDTIMKYFFLNHISHIFKGGVLGEKQLTKNQITIFIEKNGTKISKFRYLNMIQAFEDQIKKHNLSEKYLGILEGFIKSVEDSDKEDPDKQWKTDCRIRMAAVLLHRYFHIDINKKPKDLIALWQIIYPDNPLPRRKPRGKNKNPKSKKLLDEKLVKQEEDLNIYMDDSQQKKELSMSLEKEFQNKIEEEIYHSPQIKATKHSMTFYPNNNFSLDCFAKAHANQFKFVNNFNPSLNNAQFQTQLSNSEYLPLHSSKNLLNLASLNLIKENSPTLKNSKDNSNDISAQNAGTKVLNSMKSCNFIQQGPTQNKRRSIFGLSSGTSINFFPSQNLL